MNRSKSLLKRSIRLSLPVALIGTTQSLLTIVLPIIITLTELRFGQISPILGFSALAFLIGSHTWPRRATINQRYKLLKQLLIAATISQIFFVTTIIAGSTKQFGFMLLISALFITRFVYGLTASGIYPILQAWLVNEHNNSGRTRYVVLTYLSATVSTARIAVPLLAAGLSIIYSEAILLLLIMLPIAALISLPQDDRGSQIGIPYPSPVIRLPDISIVMPTLLVHTSIGLTEFIIGPYLSKEWGISLDRTLIYTALLLACIAAMMTLTQLISLRYRPSPDKMLIASPVGIACGTACAACFPELLPIGLILVAVSLALFLPASAAGAAATRHSDTHEGTSADLYTARILGHLLGVIFAGPLFEIASILPLFAAAGVALIAIPAGRKLRLALTKCQ